MAARNKIILEGRLGGIETWSTGVHFVGTTGDTVTDLTDLQTWANTIAAGIEPFVGSSLGNALSTVGFIDTVTVQSFLETGGVALQAVADTPDLNGLATATNPYPTAMVMSLRTLLPGASGRGRNYWPGLGSDIDSTGTISTADALDMAGDFAALLEFLGSSSPQPEGASPRVYSAVLDEVTVVTAIRVGVVPDTQRRRRDNLVENYQTVQYPPV